MGFLVPLLKGRCHDVDNSSQFTLKSQYLKFKFDIASVSGVVCAHRQRCPTCRLRHGASVTRLATGALHNGEFRRFSARAGRGAPDGARCRAGFGVPRRQSLRGAKAPHPAIWSAGQAAGLLRGKDMFARRNAKRRHVGNRIRGPRGRADAECRVCWSGPSPNQLPDA